MMMVTMVTVIHNTSPLVIMKMIVVVMTMIVTAMIIGTLRNERNDDGEKYHFSFVFCVSDQR